jgi:hypothetical protein
MSHKTRNECIRLSEQFKKAKDSMVSAFWYSGNDIPTEIAKTSVVARDWSGVREKDEQAEHKRFLGQ